LIAGALEDEALLPRVEQSLLRQLDGDRHEVARIHVHVLAPVAGRAALPVRAVVEDAAQQQSIGCSTTPPPLR
jgi:hypothetical protein